MAKDRGWELYNAAYTGDKKAVKKLLQEGVDANSLVSFGEETDGKHTPLMAASYGGHLAVAKALLEAGAKVDLQDINGTTALMAAADCGYFSVVDELLLHDDIQVDQKRPDGVCALVLAAKNGHTEVVDSLLRYDPTQVKLTDSDKRTALFYAAAYGRPEVVKTLVKYRADVEHEDAYGNTVLMFAKSGSFDLIRLDEHKLVNLDGRKKVVDYLQTKHQNLINFFAAATSGNLDAMKLVFSSGFKDTTDEKGNTALMLAASNGRLNVIDFLIEKGVDLNLQQSDGTDALMLAVSNGHFEVTLRLILAHVDIHKKKDGTSIFQLARENGYDDLIIFFQQQFLVAAATGHAEYVNGAIYAGININVQAEDGSTALMRATIKDRREVVSVLIDHHADLNAKNENNATALGLAACLGHQEILLKLLEVPGLEVNDRLENDMTALMWTATHDCPKVIESFLKRRDIAIEVVDNLGLDAINHAAILGNLSVVKLLHQALVERRLYTPDESGYTALDYAMVSAAFNCHAYLVKYLLDQGARLDTKLKGKTALQFAEDPDSAEVIDRGKRAATVSLLKERGAGAVVVAGEGGFVAKEEARRAEAQAKEHCI